MSASYAVTLSKCITFIHKLAVRETSNAYEDWNVSALYNADGIKEYAHMNKNIKADIDLPQKLPKIFESTLYKYVTSYRNPWITSKTMHNGRSS